MPGTSKKRSSSSKPAWQKDTVLERISTLFEQAHLSFPKNPERSRRYMEMAMKLSMRYNVRLPSSLKRKICKSCKSYLVPGKNARVRTNPAQKSLSVTCLECNHTHRFPYRKESSARKRPKK